MQREIVFPRELFERLRAHLLSDFHTEQAAFLLASPNNLKDRLRLLVREVIMLHPTDFISQSGVFLSIKPDCSQSILKRCLDEGFSLIETHSHPFCRKGVTYSSLDCENEREKFNYVAKKIPGIFHATMVFGQTDLDAHIFDAHHQQVHLIDKIIVLGLPITSFKPTSMLKDYPPNCNEIEESENRYDRQIIAFGQAGQKAISKVRVGIVGLGGIGSHIAQQLAYLGVTDFILVDHDRVENTNLNRLIGATDSDVKRRQYKVDVARRMIRRINPNARVFMKRSSALSIQAMRLLKHADVIIGATDNDSSRLLINRISIQYLIPLIDCGSGIERTDERLAAMGGQVRIILPGDGYCLNCIKVIDRVQAGLEMMTAEQIEMRRDFGYGLGPEVSAPAVVFLNGMIASLAIGEFLNLLTGYKQKQTYLVTDLKESSLLPLTVEPNINCPTCSTDAFLGRGDLEELPKWQRKSSNLPTCK